MNHLVCTVVSPRLWERADNVANFLTFFRVVICDLAGMRRVGGLSWIFISGRISFRPLRCFIYFIYTMDGGLKASIHLYPKFKKFNIIFILFKVGEFFGEYCIQAIKLRRKSWGSFLEIYLEKKEKIMGIIR